MTILSLLIKQFNTDFSWCAKTFLFKFMLLGLRMLDSPLGPTLTPADIFQHIFLWGGRANIFESFSGQPFFLPQILKPHAKFQNPGTTPSGKKVTGGERK